MASHSHGGGGAAAADEDERDLALAKKHSVSDMASHSSHGGGAAYVSDDPDDDLELVDTGERTENEENAAVARTDNDIIKAALEHPIGEKRPDFNQWASPSFSFNYFCKLPNSQFAVCLSCKTLNSKLAEGKPRRKEQFATPGSSTSG